MVDGGRLARSASPTECPGDLSSVGAGHENGHASEKQRQDGTRRGGGHRQRGLLLAVTR